MRHDPQAHRWLLEWSHDSGDPDHDIRATADTVEEARAAIDRILTGVTWTPEAAREFGGGETPSAWNHFSQGPSRPVAGARKAMAQSSTASAAARRVSGPRSRFTPWSSVGGEGSSRGETVNCGRCPTILSGSLPLQCVP